MYFLNQSECAFLCTSRETIDKIKSVLNNNIALSSHVSGYIIIDLDVLEDLADANGQPHPINQITDVITNDSECSPYAVTSLLNSSFSLLKLTPYD